MTFPPESENEEVSWKSVLTEMRKIGMVPVSWWWDTSEDFTSKSWAHIVQSVNQSGPQVCGSEGSMLPLMMCCYHLKIIELVFDHRNSVGQWNTCNMCNTYNCHLLLPYSWTTDTMPLSTEFQWPLHGQSLEACFSFDLELDSKMYQEDNGIVRNRNNQGIIYTFLFGLLPTNHSCWKWWGGKRKDRATQLFFFFLVLHYSSVSWR